MRTTQNPSLRLMRILAVCLIVLFILFFALVRFAYKSSASGQKVGLAEIIRLAESGRILEAKMLDEDSQITGIYCSARPGSDLRPSSPAATPRICAGEVRRVQAAYPQSGATTQALIEQISQRSPLLVDHQTPKLVAKQLTTFLFPLLILANLFGLIFLSTTYESAIADIVGFGKLGSRRARQRQASTGVTFADVAGAEDAVAELREVIDYLGDPKRFEVYGAAPPKGVMLFSPPGCGKTLIARAVAGESGVPFFSVSGTEFVESLVGVGAARVRDLFESVRAVAPAIVFIDEIDAVGRRRDNEGFSGGEREQTLNQLLVEMDGFDVSTGIVVMAATNRPDILDPALMRPGRFDRHVTLDPPDVAGRTEILRIHAKDKPLDGDVDLGAVARSTAGFTGADLANVINEATLLAIRHSPGTKVDMTHLAEAVQRVLHGPQRRGRIMTPDERRRIAVHESGHAVVAAAVSGPEQVSRVSVVSRGRGLGQSALTDGGERVLLTAPEMQASLVVAMAGVAAEALILDDASTTAEHDIDRANDVARLMVGRYGMSPRMGWLRVLSPHNGFSSDGPGFERVSAQTLANFDDEVRRLVDQAQQRARAILVANRIRLDDLAANLETSETLDGPALTSLLTSVERVAEVGAISPDPTVGSSA